MQQKKYSVRQAARALKGKGLSLPARYQIAKLATKGYSREEWVKVLAADGWAVSFPAGPMVKCGGCGDYYCSAPAVVEKGLHRYEFRSSCVGYSVFQGFVPVQG